MQTNCLNLLLAPRPGRDILGAFSEESRSTLNPKYIDKNHAGVFIIWDKMFGTFQEEEERPTYGITTPLNSWDPIWANFDHLRV